MPSEPATGRAYAVSGGFAQILEPLARRLGLTDFRANHLEISEGALTGRVTGPIVDREAKASHLRRWADEQGIPARSVVGVGDRANDIDMVRTVSIGVAFCAKPALNDVADVLVTKRDLTLISRVLGLTPPQD
ncbi:HAD-IB family phosphatase [Nesterenkonia pannonica]|uniref:HAD family hydrolase n=1 Tax=Nesterenkonia pannonica TaxID=1548602 RepID=UPI0021642F37|nr:HAD-IB family phosphatase [Nesterenkonia pannonica]